MQASGAAVVTVVAQAFSVLLCILIIRKRGLPFTFTKKSITLDIKIVLRIVKIGFPVSYFRSKLPNTTLLKIGLATPASTIVQIIFCSVCLWLVIRGERRESYGKY